MDVHMKCDYIYCY